MAWTIAAQVKQDGALTYNLFNLADDAALTTLVNAKIAVASAWLTRRVGSTIYATTDTGIQTILAQAESWLCLCYLVPIIKASKVYGTHYPIDTEESSSFDGLMDTDWRRLAIELLDEWAEIEPAGVSYSLPVFSTTQAVDRTDTTLESTDQQYQDNLAIAESSSLTVTPIANLY